MQIVILLAFLISQVAQDIQTFPVSGIVLALAVATYLAGTTLLGLAGLRLSGRALQEPEAATGRTLRFRNRLSLVNQIWLLIGLAVILALGYRQWIDNVLRLSDVPLLGDLILLAPFFAGLILMWVLDYPFHRSIRRRLSENRVAVGRTPLPCWTRRQYVIFHVRHSLLFILVPVGLILLCLDTLHLYVYPLLPEGAWRDGVLIGGSLLCIALVFLLAPCLIVRIWKTTPLPPGPLRWNLEDLCRRLGVNFRELLIWQSDGVLANAAAMGLIGRVRYVLLSDALLNDMPKEHIRAIFAHELGHIRHHHIFYAGLFAMSSAMLCTSAAYGAAGLAKLPEWGESVLGLMLLGWVWATGFGFVSKRFERQCDVVGAWCAGLDRPPADPDETGVTPEGAAVFAAALEQVGELNGIPPGQRNWRHGRLGDRVEYVRTVLSRQKADRSVRRIQWLLWIALGAGLAAFLAMVLSAGPQATTL
jgi:STE24 endopeptidase